MCEINILKKIEIAKSIAKSGEINWKSMVQYNGSKKHPLNKKKIEKKNAMKSRIVVRTNLFIKRKSLKNPPDTFEL